MPRGAHGLGAEGVPVGVAHGRFCPVGRQEQWQDQRRRQSWRVRALHPVAPHVHGCTWTWSVVARVCI